MKGGAVDICIATHNRPELLSNLLRTLENQSDLLDTPVKINICDNDPKGTASSVVAEFRSRGMDIAYCVESIRNISLARNRSMELGSAPYIAMIDDDELAGPRWIRELLDTLNLFEADVVHGNRRYHLPRSLRGCEGLFATSGAASGATEGYPRGTNNCMFRRDLITNENFSFDPEFGLTGGGDFDFFKRVESSGRRLVFSKEAITYEVLHGNRSNLGYILRTKFRTGQVMAKVIGRHLSFIARVQFVLSSALRVLMGSCLTSVFLPFSIIRRGPFLCFLSKSIHHFGRLSYLLFGKVNLKED